MGDLTLLSAVAADRFITVASTTSTDNSGLFRYLLPLFQKDTGIEVRVVAVGTGQAIELAQRGDADVPRSCITSRPKRSSWPKVLGWRALT